MGKEYCKKCGQAILTGFSFFGSQEKSVEFEDGWYCYRCAKAKVEEVRKNK